MSSHEFVPHPAKFTSGIPGLDRDHARRGARDAPLAIAEAHKATRSNQAEEKAG
jgi:hypothetical protein